MHQEKVPIEAHGLPEKRDAERQDTRGDRAWNPSDESSWDSITAGPLREVRIPAISCLPSASALRRSCAGQAGWSGLV